MWCLHAFGERGRGEGCWWYPLPKKRRSWSVIGFKPRIRIAYTSAPYRGGGGGYQNFFRAILLRYRLHRSSPSFYRGWAPKKRVNPEGPFSGAIVNARGGPAKRFFRPKMSTRESRPRNFHAGLTDTSTPFGSSVPGQKYAFVCPCSCVDGKKGVHAYRPMT